MIEMLVVVAILGLMALAIYPAMNNAMRTRTFDNAAKDIMTIMQKAKLASVRTKLSHRVRFLQIDSVWYYTVEQETTSGTWNRVSGFVEKSIPPEFLMTINLPLKTVTYSSLGFVSDYVTGQNIITLQSLKLKGGGQEDLRTVSVYTGGSVQYAKAKS